MNGFANSDFNAGVEGEDAWAGTRRDEEWDKVGPSILAICHRI
jgi:hypothetical protein